MGQVGLAFRCSLVQLLTLRGSIRATRQFLRAEVGGSARDKWRRLALFLLLLLGLETGLFLFSLEVFPHLLGKTRSIFGIPLFPFDAFLLTALFIGFLALGP